MPVRSHQESGFTNTWLSLNKEITSNTGDVAHDMMIITIDTLDITHDLMTSSRTHSHRTVNLIIRNCEAGTAQLVVYWAHCPDWCSIVGLILIWGEFFQQRGFSPWSKLGFWLHSPKTLSDENINQKSSLCTYAFHYTDAKSPDVHVLDGWLPKQKHPACITH